MVFALVGLPRPFSRLRSPARMLVAKSGNTKHNKRQDQLSAMPTPTTPLQRL
ncbi:hypothetical protein AM571_PC01791 (plasmid) [Rhizobium etli 8C-3]|uniref:Uncharacterized protein n=1 Tax=Rhizobium etli 8C-3 TaxID=538025 RepID=A0A1L5PHC7_RHIET|nr:hypothetical protein AM571_PC01791 [Rhizobium etli 8C-3]